MTALAAGDAALLASDLPPLRRVNLPGQGARVIEYRESGPGDEPTILMLHGTGSSSAGYRAQLAGLSDRYRVVAWNAPGYGTSTPLASPDPTAGDYAAAVEELMDALGISRAAVLVGSSWGSVIALNLAVVRPARVGALVLSAPNTARGAMPEEARQAAIAEMRRNVPRPDADRGAVADRLLTPDTPAAVRALVERLRDDMTPTGWLGAMHMMFTTDTPSIIGQVRCPVAILAGTRDRLAPLELHAGLLHAGKPDAALHVLEGYGHMLKLEAPGPFNEIVRGLPDFQ
ncbi:alpha/beta hydrolase [Roseomonas sp. KE2513]|uniref:alpha/beta fold hydrolase n=1 Tax=Roseomonas sp. KE2513 TaxID=2479202 RepID=UPI0018DFAD61|nr:alpha/beta hydrolase [Roseomonas sp. KE2513]MBI0537231.1 alpha/beta hydrolase [Roseomonas sp. KE2513]